VHLAIDDVHFGCVRRRPAASPLRAERNS
jgi:hypothetical protein